MSSVDIHCEIPTRKYGNGLGEVKLETEDIRPYQPSLATIIASEVVSDIIDNALDIALNKSEIDWDKSCRMPKRPDELNIRQNYEFNPPTLNDPSLSPNIKQIIEGLNSISVNNSSATKNTEEPVQLDIEMKKLLTEMMSPPYPIVNYEVAPRKDGVGDQPLQPTMQEELLYLENRSEDILVDVEQTRIVEKKSRVTDLVMNSKQVLSELLMNENAKKNLELWEEQNEEVMKVIDLEHVEPGDISFPTESKLAVCKKPDNIKILPEDIPLPPDEGESSTYPDYDYDSQILPLPNEDIMDIVDLSKDAFQDEERQLTPGEESCNHGGKGDVYNTIVTIGDQSIAETEKLKQKDVEKCTKKESKKKKWNIGSRILGFLKKRPKNKEECTTSQ